MKKILVLGAFVSCCFGREALGNQSLADDPTLHVQEQAGATKLSIKETVRLHKRVEYGKPHWTRITWDDLKKDEASEIAVQRIDSDISGVIEAFRMLRRNQNLVHLHLWADSINRECMEELAKTLESNHNIRTIRISGPTSATHPFVEDKELRILKEGIEKSHVWWVNWKAEAYGGENNQLLNQIRFVVKENIPITVTLKDSTKKDILLKQLENEPEIQSIESAKLADDYIAHLASDFCRSKASELHINGGMLSSELMAKLQSAGNVLLGMESLFGTEFHTVFVKTADGEAFWKNLGSAKEKESLQKLYLINGDELSFERVSKILKDESFVTDLCVLGGNISQQTRRAFVDAVIESRGLRYLHLDREEFCVRDMIKMGCATLKRRSLIYITPRDGEKRMVCFNDLVAIENIKKVSIPRFFWMGGGGASEFLRDLIQILQQKRTVESLCFDRAALNDDCLKEIGDLLKENMLRTLSIDGGAISEVGLMALDEGIMSNSSLTSLTIQNMKVTGELGLMERWQEKCKENAAISGYIPQLGNSSLIEENDEDSYFESDDDSESESDNDSESESDNDY